MTTPIRAADAPFPVELEAGQRIFWCVCGRSENQPFCDGSHKGTGISPVRYTPEANQKAFLCGCKQTQNPPFCDGSHNKTTD